MDFYFFKNVNSFSKYLIMVGLSPEKEKNNQKYKKSFCTKKRANLHYS